MVKNMNRLTIKNDEKYFKENIACVEYNNYGCFIKNRPYRINFINTEVETKLGKLEDLEEQLGCPLEVVLDIIINSKPIYYKTLEGVELKLHPMFMSNCGIKCNQWYYSSNPANNRPDEFMISFKGYQKTWWLKGEKPNE